MIRLAIIHAVWPSLLPIGIIVVIRGGTRRRKSAIVVGGVLVALAIPAVAFCTVMWPLDFLLRLREIRVPVVARGYTVTLVQRPGADFYESFFEVRRSDGKIAQVMIDGDDRKWWRPRVIVQGARSYFVRGFGAIQSRTAFVDAGDGTLFSGYYGRIFDLGDLGFEDAAPS